MKELLIQAGLVEGSVRLREFSDGWHDPRKEEHNLLSKIH